MTQNEWLLNFVGLVISVIGSIFLFFGTPRDTKDEPIRETNSMERFDYYNEEKQEKESKKFRWRFNFSRIGIVMVGVGFILQ